MLDKLVLPSVIAILISPFREVFVVSRLLVLYVLLAYVVGKIVPQMFKYNKFIGLVNMLVTGGAAASLFFLRNSSFSL